MPSSFRILFILLFLVFEIDAKVSAQIPVVDGFLVTNDRDTISGKFEYVSKSLFENKLVFIKRSGTAISVFRPPEIRGLFSGASVGFESKEVEGERMFLRVLSRGHVNLYSDGKDLFISDSSIRAVELKGGKKAVVIDGKNYVQRFNNYKSQLREYVNDPAYSSRIGNLYYSQNEVLRFVREVNNDRSDPAKPHVYNRGYFGFEGGAYITSMERRMTDDDFDMRNDDWGYRVKRHFVRSWTAGLAYKLKILKTRSHIGAGLQYEQTPLTTVEDRLLFSIGPFSFPSDTIAELVHRYTYKFSSVNFSFGFYPEVSNGRLRPFFDVGFAGKVYLENEASFKKTRYENGVMVEETEGTWNTPTFLIGPKGGAGCRLIIDMNRSVALGFTAELYASSKIEMDIVRIFAKRFYVVYGF